MVKEHLRILYLLGQRHDLERKTNVPWICIANFLIILKFFLKYSCYVKEAFKGLYFSWCICDEFFFSYFQIRDCSFSNPFHFQNVQTIDYYSSLSFLNFSSRWIYRNDSSFPLEKKNWVFCDSDISALHHDCHSLPSVILA